MAESNAKEDADNLRAEYAVLGQHHGPTSIIRFASFAAFFPLNGALLAAVVNNRGALLASVLGVLCSIVWWLIERRTIDAHSIITQRGRDLERALRIENGIFTQTVDRPPRPFGHGRILKWFYVVAIIFWLTFLGVHLLVPAAGTEEQLSLTVIRGSESWQFFAFVFAAILLLIYGLIDELQGRPLKVFLKIVSFLMVGYFTLLSPAGRNLLVALLNAFKMESP